MSEFAILSKQDLENFKADILKEISTTQKASSLSEFCTESELMEKLDHPDPSTVWRWRKNGQLPEPIEIGNQKLYRISDIIQMRARSRNTPKVHLR